ncbi:MAG: LLM class flavin-dependent oxidoreductase [Rhodospirillaceae bacterium]|jgi:alkanesulfonate monooxygenase SsuD/methylene tetrahydromethanopterin reductase-like flavin-dependent oxidoreductase (luciferase family)|nr:LLM class flavin-dependent oxidoreductase [Rhodospirillaceae bacterium]MBT5193872.1 LLM class flavin-dependent oxidoreductase [Rhodospirillaceae bacterium]
MHFGIFMEFGFRDGGSEAEAFREGLDLVDAAEAWGMDSAWLSEFHFSPERSVLSSPIVVAGALAARTQRMRIGLAVYVLPLNNPLRIAEEAATVDQLSGGRFDFGIGRSGFVRSYNAYNIDYGESQDRFEESLEILRLAWSGKKFSFDGKYYQVMDALVVPQPVQKPHPPMRMAATSPATFKTVAELGLPLFVGLRGDGLGTLVENIKMYRETWRRSGHDGDGSVYLRVPIYAADTEAAALEEPRENIIYYFERQARLVAASSPKGGSAARANTAATLSALSYDDILRDRVAFGTATRLIDRINEWREVLGIDGITAEMNAGGMLSEPQVTNSLRIITRDVMPAFK